MDTLTLSSPVINDPSRRELDRPSPTPESSTIDLDADQKDVRSRDDGTLDAERGTESHLQAPGLLEVAHGKSAEDTGKVDQG